MSMNLPDLHVQLAACCNAALTHSIAAKMGLLENGKTLVFGELGGVRNSSGAKWIGLAARRLLLEELLVLEELLLLVEEDDASVVTINLKH